MASTVRLQKILSAAGSASRRGAETMIAAGRVSVNGVVLKNLGRKADPQSDDIRLDGRRVGLAQRRRYILMNKPSGYLTTRHDPQRRKTVLELLPRVREYVYPVGRLDYDSEGLLLMTNDGDLAYHLMHPRYEFEKEYHFLVDNELTAAQIQSLQKGVMIDEQVTASAKLMKLYGTKGHWYSITLREGRKRQVRRMLVSVGQPLRALRRVRLHTLQLGSLGMGTAQQLSDEELSQLSTK